MVLKVDGLMLAVSPSKLDGVDPNWVVSCIKVDEHVGSLSIKVDGSKI